MRIPTLAIVGCLDPNLAGVRTLKRLMPSLRVVVIDGAGPGPTLRHPDFVRSVASFLAEHDARP